MARFTYFAKTEINYRLDSIGKIKRRFIETRGRPIFQVFEVLKKEQPNYMEKISAVIGDCMLPNLGIGEQYQEILKNEVTIYIFFFFRNRMTR